MRFLVQAACGYGLTPWPSPVLAMTGAGFLLVQIMTIWAGVMGLVYLGYFRFAKSMREAPEVND